MSDELRSRIARLLAEVPVTALPGAAVEAQARITKAGILPFLPAASTENWRFLLMQPLAAHAHLGAPKFQLAKGTRMQHTGGVWKDIRGPVTGTPETLATTALREGFEELGLDISGITQLFDCGASGFTSASTGHGKRLWLFAAAMRDEHCLLPADAELARTTARRAWLSLAELAAQVREDHAGIIREAYARLSA